MMLDRIVEVFCDVDDFCKAFVPQWEASLLGTGGPAPRGSQPGLSSSEIITLLLVHHSSGFKHLKSFYHGFAAPLLRGYFPGMPCYAHFVRLQKSVFVPAVFFLLSHLGTRTGLYYIDHFGSLDRLAVDHRCGGVRLASLRDRMSLAQNLIAPLPGSFPAPRAQVVVNILPRRQIVRHH